MIWPLDSHVSRNHYLNLKMATNCCIDLSHMFRRKCGGGTCLSHLTKHPSMRDSWLIRVEEEKCILSNSALSLALCCPTATLSSHQLGFFLLCISNRLHVAQLSPSSKQRFCNWAVFVTTFIYLENQVTQPNHSMLLWLQFTLVLHLSMWMAGSFVELLHTRSHLLTQGIPGKILLFLRHFLSFFLKTL